MLLMDVTLCWHCVTHHICGLRNIMQHCVSFTTNMLFRVSINPVHLTLWRPYGDSWKCPWYDGWFKYSLYTSLVWLGTLVITSLFSILSVESFLPGKPRQVLARRLCQDFPYRQGFLVRNMFAAGSVGLRTFHKGQSISHTEWSWQYLIPPSNPCFEKTFSKLDCESLFLS